MPFLQDLFNFGVHVSGSVPTLTDSQNASDLHLTDSFLSRCSSKMFFFVFVKKNKKEERKTNQKTEVVAIPQFRGFYFQLH